ncbi:MAG: hypothetical protein KGH60_02790 [Candidatus Micrarchaeota archaeon]|nr:hypothetical protein [Candidatus Micrarchaeota archaeon]
MPRQSKRNANAKQAKEPVFIVKPAMKHGGLDYLHISLIALVIILVAVAFALSAFKQQSVNILPANATNYTSAQALSAAERVISSYATFNTSLSLIPFYSLVNQSKVAYAQSQNEWVVTVPYVDPLASNTIFNFTVILNGSTLKPSLALTQTLKPSLIGNNTISSLGSITLANKVLCTTSKPIPVYLITDPYAPGALHAMSVALNASMQDQGKINMSYYYVFSNYAVRFYPGYGINQTQGLGRFFSCASRQPGHLSQFISNYSIAATGAPLSYALLLQIAAGSGENMSSFNGCLVNASQSLNQQSLLANLYSTGVNPEFVVNCKYVALPETLGHTINYSISTLPANAASK